MNDCNSLSPPHSKNAAYPGSYSVMGTQCRWLNAAAVNRRLLGFLDVCAEQREEFRMNPVEHGVKLVRTHTNTHTHTSCDTHTYIYIYMYTYICVCVYRISTSPCTSSSSPSMFQVRVLSEGMMGVCLASCCSSSRWEHGCSFTARTRCTSTNEKLNYGTMTKTQRQKKIQ